MLSLVPLVSLVLATDPVPNAPEPASVVRVEFDALPDRPIAGGVKIRPSGGLGGGGRVGDAPHNHDHDCITPHERARAGEAIARHEALRGPASFGARSSILYPFFPMGSNWYRDALLGNFVDLDPTAGILDWDCSAYSYDGHRGHDNGIRSFAEQLVGVPIFAAAPGIVVDSHDGEPDMNTVWMNVPANYVIIDHGMGRYAYYWHMKMGSVAVAPSQTVVAGQQIGLVGSSGFSSGPHLHFESHDGAAVFEPFAGACRPGASGWTDQQGIDRTLRCFDLGFTPIDMTTVQPPPHMLPRTGHLGTDEIPHYFWFMLYNLPANSQWSIRYFRPGGSLEFAAGPFPFNNANTYPWSWWWTYWFVPAMGTTLGTWHVELRINGEIVAFAPVEVLPERDPDFNRPPEALDGLSFEPSAPQAGDALFCRIDTSLYLDDRDYDVVRYTYEWTRNAVPIRTITSAGHADAIPAFSATDGDVIRCTVTPSDGLVDGPSMFAEITVGDTTCVADIDDGSGTGTPDNAVDISDLLYYLFLFDAGDPGADLDDGSATGTPDGGVDISDLLYFLARFDAGC